MVVGIDGFVLMAEWCQFRMLLWNVIKKVMEGIRSWIDVISIIARSWRILDLYN